MSLFNYKVLLQLLLHLLFIVSSQANKITTSALGQRDHKTYLRQRAIKKWRWAHILLFLCHILKFYSPYRQPWDYIKDSEVSFRFWHGYYNQGHLLNLYFFLLHTKLIIFLKKYCLIFEHSSPSKMKN